MNTMHDQGQDNYVCNIEIAVSTHKREKAYSRLIGRGGNVIRRMSDIPVQRSKLIRTSEMFYSRKERRRRKS